MAMHVFIQSSARFLPAGTLISSPQPAKFVSFLVHQCPPIVELRAIHCWRRRKRKRPLSLPPQLKRLVGQVFLTVLSNPRILPSPLNLIAEEFVGVGDDGNGGNSGSWGGSGSGSGSGWLWPDGWGRRGLKRGLGFWLVVILIGLSLVIVEEIEINRQLGVLMGLGLGLGIGMMGYIEKLIKDYWVLGFCCFGVLLLGLGLNKELRSSAGKFVSGASKWRGGGGRRRNRRRFLGFRK